MNAELSPAPQFSSQRLKNGHAKIFHGSTLATTWRGPAATNFLAGVEVASESVQQQLMARLTGNYKRGSERQAGHHPRNSP